MSIEELRAEALKLTPQSRARLARELLASLDDLSDDEIQGLWLDEAARRLEELDKGLATASPVEDVMARARSGRK